MPSLNQVSLRMGFLLCCLFCSLLSAASTNRLLVTDHGAIGDGKTLNTAALQKAIDTCAGWGGGTVVFPAGRYLSGTLFLRSHVALHLEAGSVLLGSTNLADYPKRTPAFRSYACVNYVERSLIYAEKQQHVAIVGQGTIDGQGQAESFKHSYGRATYKKRPYLIRMTECRDVILRDVTIQNAAMWVQHYLACDDLLIDGVTVRSRVNHNNDGIDIDCCQRVRIANCIIDSGDDAIVLKSTAPRLCRDVTVTNCVLSSHCNAFKLGTESTGGFEDIVLSNCVLHDTRLAGIALEIVDGGKLSRVSITNVTMRDVLGGIFIRLGNRARPYLSQGPGGSVGTWSFPPGVTLPVPGVGSLDGVTISNVQIHGGSKIGCSITGLPGYPVRNVTLENIRVHSAGGGTLEDAQREIQERPSSYPEFSMFGVLPAYGFYVRHAQGLRFDHLDLSYAKPEARPALMLEDVKDADVMGLRAQVSGESVALVHCRQVQNALISGCRLGSSDHPLVAVFGKGNSNLNLIGNVCPRPVELGPEVKQDVVYIEGRHK